MIIKNGSVIFKDTVEKRISAFSAERSKRSRTSSLPNRAKKS